MTTGFRRRKAAQSPPLRHVGRLHWKMGGRDKRGTLHLTGHILRRPTSKPTRRGSPSSVGSTGVEISPPERCSSSPQPHLSSSLRANFGFMTIAVPHGVRFTIRDTPCLHVPRGEDCRPRDAPGGGLPPPRRCWVSTATTPSRCLRAKMWDPDIAAKKAHASPIATDHVHAYPVGGIVVDGQHPRRA